MAPATFFASAAKSLLKSHDHHDLKSDRQLVPDQAIHVLNVRKLTRTNDVTNHI